MTDVKEKFGLFKELVGLFDTKLKATVTTILALAVVYLVWKNGNDKDRLYGMVIEEVRKQVPGTVSKEVTKQTAPIKAVADSNSRTISQYSETLDTVIHDTKTLIKGLTKDRKR